MLALTSAVRLVASKETTLKLPRRSVPPSAVEPLSVGRLTVAALVHRLLVLKM